MKHKIIVLVSIATIVGVLVGSGVTYEHQRQWQDLKNAKASAHAWAVKQAAAKEQAKQAAKVKALETQCAKDHQLFVQTNGKSAAGDCNVNLQIVQ